MGVVVVREGLAVQSLSFKRYLPVGKPSVVVDYLNRWGVDEISVVDISATKKGTFSTNLVSELSNVSQVPLSYGGGIKTTEDMTKLVQAGADKVIVNQAFLGNPQIVTEGAKHLGNQCIIVSLDVIRDSSGNLQAYNYLSGSALKQDPVSLARLAEKHGAGEIFLNSVNKDGAKSGYDLEAAQTIARSVKIPVTLCGGVGHPSHFVEGLKINNVSAVAAANFFNFTEHSVTLSKRFISAQVPDVVRTEIYFDYKNAAFLNDGRLAKKEDKVLKELLFEYHPEEVI